MISGLYRFLTGKPFINTKDTKVTKEKRSQNQSYSPFVYFESFVFRRFPANYGRADFGKCTTEKCRLELYKCKPETLDSRPAQG
jgi:hypothetical protein